jgi:hypothetical protein
MAKREPYKNRIELLQGTLDLLILHTLQWGAQHGHGIGQAIRSKSAELLQVETGSLYPALHRLEEHGWITSEWKISETAHALRQATAFERTVPLETDGKSDFQSHEARLNRL